MKSTINVFLIALVCFFSTVSCNKDGCEGFTTSVIDAFIAANGGDELATALDVGRNTNGSLIQLNAGITGNYPSRLGLGGAIMDSWYSTTVGTANEFGRLFIDAIPYNKIGSDVQSSGSSDDKSGVHQKFDGLTHELTLYNRSGGQILMQTNCVLPRSFALDNTQTNIFIKKNINGDILLSWVGGDLSSDVFITFLVSKEGINEPIEKSFLKAYKVQDGGSFIIPFADFSHLVGKLAMIHVLRYKALNVPDNRDTDRKNAVVLSTSMSDIIVL